MKRNKEVIKTGVRASGDFWGEKEAHTCFYNAGDVLYVNVHILCLFNLHR